MPQPVIAIQARAYGWIICHTSHADASVISVRDAAALGPSIIGSDDSRARSVVLGALADPPSADHSADSWPSQSTPPVAALPTGLLGHQ